MSLKFRVKHAAVAVGVAAISTVVALTTLPAQAATPGGDLTVIRAGKGDGPNAVTVASSASLPNHLLFMPADLSKVKTLPVFAYAEGGCLNYGELTPNILSEIASYGFLVIADGTQNYTSLSFENVNTLKAGITWAVNQNTKPGSAFHGKIDTTAIAAGGLSCGGLEAIAAGADPRVKTTVAISSGLFGYRAPTLAALHGPLAYIEGGTGDVAYSNGLADFNAAPPNLPVFFGSLKGYPHGGSLGLPYAGPTAKAVIAWLQYQLEGNQTAAHQFTGPQCGLCTNPAWQVKQHNL